MTSETRLRERIAAASLLVAPGIYDALTAKLRAAVDQRSREDFIIIARTDALAVEGRDATLERAHAYAEAGADVIFVEALETVEQMERVPKLFDVPSLINMAPRTPDRPVAELESEYKVD